MAHNNTVLSQMLQLLPRHVFEQQVETHAWQGPKPRKLSYWSQLVAMLYAQLSGKKSLRDLVFSLGRHRQKLYHLGLNPVKRSSLADANKQRPALIFAQTYFKLLHRLETELGRQPGPHRVKIMDATYVPVSDSRFPWADFMPGKSAVKLHFLLDADAGTPQDLQVTSGQVHELEVARKLSFSPGDLLLLDRGYVDFAWLYSLHQQGVGFVTRLPRNVRYQVVQKNPVSAGAGVLADQAYGSHRPIATAAIRKPCASCVIGTGNRQEICFSDQPPGPARLGGGRSLSAALADRDFFPVDQAKSENQNLLWHLGEWRSDPNLDRLDRPYAPPLD
jgi:putative transposase